MGASEMPPFLAVMPDEEEGGSMFLFLGKGDLVSGRHIIVCFGLQPFDPVRITQGEASMLEGPAMRRTEHPTVRDRVGSVLAGWDERDDGGCGSIVVIHRHATTHTAAWSICIADKPVERVLVEDPQEW
jgi:hypothetical protein